MTLINAIISSPEDLDFRLHLRNEFMRIGLLEVLEVRDRIGRPRAGLSERVLPSKILSGFRSKSMRGTRHSTQGVSRSKGRGL